MRKGIDSSKEETYPNSRGIHEPPKQWLDYTEFYTYNVRLLLERGNLRTMQSNINKNSKIVGMPTEGFQDGSLHPNPVLFIKNNSYFCPI